MFGTANKAAPLREDTQGDQVVSLLLGAALRRHVAR